MFCDFAFIAVLCPDYACFAAACSDLQLEGAERLRDGLALPPRRINGDPLAVREHKTASAAVENLQCGRAE